MHLQFQPPPPESVQGCLSKEVMSPSTVRKVHVHTYMDGHGCKKRNIAWTGIEEGRTNAGRAAAPLRDKFRLPLSSSGGDIQRRMWSHKIYCFDLNAGGGGGGTIRSVVHEGGEAGTEQHCFWRRSRKARGSRRPKREERRIEKRR